MSPATAKRRYTLRLLGVTAGYLGSLVGVVSILNDHPDMTLGARIALSVLPAIFVIAMLVVMWKFFSEMDEVARHFNERAINVAAFVVLAISGSYGLIDMLVEGLPPLHIFWVFPIFFGVFGLVKATMKDVVC